MRSALLVLTGCTKLLGVHDLEPLDAAIDPADAHAVDAAPIVDGPSPDADPLAVGLLAHLTFDSPQVGADVTGNGHDGTCSNGTCVAVPGKLGTAVRFDGAAEMTLAGAFPTTPFTIAVWLSNASNDTSANCAYGREIGNNTGYTLCFAKGAAELITSTGTSPLGVAGTGYHHYGLTWDGMKARSYVDGALKDTRSADFSTVASKFFVGFEGRTNQFVGDVDDLRYYGRVLSADELQLLTSGAQ